MTKKAGSNGKGKSGFGDYWFVEVRLSEEDKQTLETREWTDHEQFDSIRGLVAEGYKFSLNEDSKNQSFIATLTDNREGSAAYHGILSGRGATPFNAVCSLLYKHYALLGETWPVDYKDGGRGASLFG